MRLLNSASINPARDERRVHVSTTRRRSLLATLLALWVTACGANDPAAIEAPQPRQPLAGTYDFTARLTGFSFETAAPSPPDCPDFTQYCTHQRAAGGGSLAGVLIVGDSALQQSSTLSDYPDIRASLTGQFCAAVDLAVPNGCAQLGATTTFEYQHGDLWPAYPFDGNVPFLGVLTGPGAGEGHLRFQTARFDADSLYGTVYWALAPGRSPPTYSGTFVARRRSVSP